MLLKYMLIVYLAFVFESVLSVPIVTIREARLNSMFTFVCLG